MKKFKKRVMAFLMISAMAVTAAAVPQTASAATPKATVKSATLKVSTAKISGFKKIEGIMKAGKYFMAYGTDSKKQNVYACSTDGKKFSKAKKIGINGELSYRTCGKYLYVINISNPKKASYKCVSDTSKLGSAKVHKISFSLPSGFQTDYAYTNDYWGFQNEKTGKVYMQTMFYGSDTNGGSSYAYYAALSPSGAKTINMTSKAKSLLKTSDLEIRDMASAYDATTWYVGSVVTDYHDSAAKSYFLYTTNGSTFKLSPAIPSSSSNARFSVDWIGRKAMAYRSYEASEDYSKEDYTFQSDSKKHGVYYLLDTKTNKWSKKTTGKYTAVNGFSSGFAANVYTYYSNTTGSKEYMLLSDIGKKSIHSILSSNGKSWSSLPKLTLHSTKYQISSVGYYKTPSGTYAEETYYVNSSSKNNKKYLVYSKLTNGKWKKLKALTVTEGNGYAYDNQLYNNIPTLIYNNKNTTVGYNLKTGKSYVLPFKYQYNNVMYGDSSTFHSGSKLYCSKDGFKTVRKISLKAGSKVIKSNITATYIQRISKKSVYAYILCGSKMYYTTTSSILNVK